MIRKWLALALLSSLLAMPAGEALAARSASCPSLFESPSLLHRDARFLREAFERDSAESVGDSGLSKNDFEISRRLTASERYRSRTGPVMRPGYAEHLGPSFLNYLKTLNEHDVILDTGAGRAHAWIQYHSEMKGPARVVAFAIKKPNDPLLDEHLQTTDRMNYIEGDFFATELLHVRQVSLVVDVFGAWAYGSRADRYVNQIGRLLKPGGRAYLVRGNVVVERAGFDAWLRSIEGFEVIDSHRQFVTLERTTAPLKVPRLHAVEIKEGRPPTTIYHLD